MNFFQHMTDKEMKSAIEQRILQCVTTLMTRGSPQDQLLAGGQILVLLEVADGAGYDIRKELSKNPMCKKAFDVVVELRHFDCKVLEERNMKLPLKRGI